MKIIKSTLFFLKQSVTPIEYNYKANISVLFFVNLTLHENIDLTPSLFSSLQQLLRCVLLKGVITYIFGNPPFKM